jgi:hypothetical protein
VVVTLHAAKQLKAIAATAHNCLKVGRNHAAVRALEAADWRSPWLLLSAHAFQRHGARTLRVVMVVTGTDAQSGTA